MSPLDCVVAGGAWAFLLAAIGRDELRRVVGDFRDGLRRTSYPPPAVPLPAQPVVRAPLRTPTAEELERWINAPAAPDPRRLV